MTSFVLAGGHAVSGILLIMLGTTVGWNSFGQYQNFSVVFLKSDMIASGVSLSCLVSERWYNYDSLSLSQKHTHSHSKVV